MTFYERLQKLEQMDALIQRKGTGTPEQFAKRLNLTRSTFYRHLEQLSIQKEKKISYCTKRQTYYYDEEC